MLSRNLLVGFLKPEVPGFWSSYGFVQTNSTAYFPILTNEILSGLEINNFCTKKYYSFKISQFWNKNNSIYKCKKQLESSLFKNFGQKFDDFSAKWPIIRPEWGWKSVLTLAIPSWSKRDFFTSFWPYYWPFRWKIIKFLAKIFEHRRF